MAWHDLLRAQATAPLAGWGELSTTSNATRSTVSINLCLGICCAQRHVPPPVYRSHFMCTASEQWAVRSAL